MNMFWPGSAARLPSGRGWTGLVFSGQNPLGQRRKDDLADAFALAQRNDFFFNPAPDHVVVRLVGDQRVQARAPDVVHGMRDLAGAPLGNACIEDLALPRQVVERDQRLFQRRLGVIPVALVKVNVVRAEPLQRERGTAQKCACGIGRGRWGRLPIGKKTLVARK